MVPSRQHRPHSHSTPVWPWFLQGSTDHTVTVDQSGCGSFKTAQTTQSQQSSLAGCSSRQHRPHCHSRPVWLWCLQDSTDHTVTVDQSGCGVFKTAQTTQSQYTSLAVAPSRQHRPHSHSRPVWLWLLQGSTDHTVTVDQSGCGSFKAAQTTELGDVRQVSPDRVNDKATTVVSWDSNLTPCVWARTEGTQTSLPSVLLLSPSRWPCG